MGDGSDALPSCIWEVTDLLNKPEKAAWLFILPSMLILLVFTIVPVVASIGVSFFDLNMFFKNTHFAGLANYQKLIGDARVWNSLKNTFQFVLMEVPFQVALGLLVAVLVSRSSLFCKMARSVLFIPVVCSLTSISIIWSLILDPTIGILPYYLRELGLGRQTFLKDPDMAMGVIVFLSVWKNFGQTMVLLLAGIQSISPAYYEAAVVEGAGAWTRFIRITLPLILPNISFCVVTNLIGSMQVFDQVYVTTRGGPLFRTETAVVYIYSRAFSQPFALGYASAIATVLFAAIMILALSLNRWFLKREEAIYA